MSSIENHFRTRFLANQNAENSLLHKNLQSRSLAAVLLKFHSRIIYGTIFDIKHTSLRSHVTGSADKNAASSQLHTFRKPNYRIIFLLL